MPRKIILRVLLALLIASTAIVAMTNTAAAADDVGTEKMKLRFCNEPESTTLGDENALESHGGKMKCKTFCFNGETVELKVRHENGGWRGKKFREMGAIDGACGSPEAAPPEPDRRSYCTTDGQHVDLLKFQPDEDPAYAGAIPAAYVDGEGTTCDLNGLTFLGTAVDGVGTRYLDPFIAELVGDPYRLATRS